MSVALAIKPSLDLNYEPTIVADTSAMPEHEWHEWRRKGIGGSDVAAIYGLSPFGTARDLYNVKIGLEPVVPDEDNWVAKEYGHCLEDLVAQVFSRKTGLEVYQQQKLFAHPLFPFMQANVDRFIRFPDGTTGILECKTTNHHNSDKWADDAIPINYEYQVRHYLSVMNIDVAYIACLYGNNENEFVYRRIDRDLDVEADMIEAEKFFWEYNVLGRVPPPYTESGDLVLASLRRYLGSADAMMPEITLPHSFEADLALYTEKHEQKLQLNRQADAIDKELKHLQAKIAVEMGTSCKAVCESLSQIYRIAYNPSTRTGISKDNLEKMRLNAFAVYEQYVTTTDSRRFSVKKEKIS